MISFTKYMFWEKLLLSFENLFVEIKDVMVSLKDFFYKTAKILSWFVFRSEETTPV